LRKGVMQMGNGRRARALRFAICFIVILAIMIYIAPKACWPPGCNPSGQHSSTIWRVRA